MPELDQERKATEIRTILERTIATLYPLGLLEPTHQGWCYQGPEEVLLYDPNAARLRIQATDRSWQLEWHEGLLVAEQSTLITEEQLSEFREFGQRLEGYENGNVQALEDFQADRLLSQAAQLFEYYARQGDAAFKFSAESTEHFYRVQLEGDVYLISRDDATGMYALQREDQTALTDRDGQHWEQVQNWLDHLETQSVLPVPESSPYWEQQLAYANQMLPHLRSLLNTEPLELDEERQSYLLSMGEYTIGHIPCTDTLWLERQGERLLSAKNISQHPDFLSEWNLMEIDDLGYLTKQDVRYFQEWAYWIALQNSDRSLEEPDFSSQEDLSFPHEPNTQDDRDWER